MLSVRLYYLHQFLYFIHIPVLGATNWPPHFNPRTRVGCDAVRLWIARTRRISIHAPVWGATMDETINWLKEYISIHAPVWGATAVRDKMRPIMEFQSTHPCRVRRAIVSPRLPVGYFNPRTRVGCDKSKMRMVRINVPFQSTHPCGVRQAFTRR